MLEDIGGGILWNPTGFPPCRDVLGAKPLRYKGSGAWKGILVLGRFETAGQSALVNPRHRGHAADRDLESAIGLQSELSRVPQAVLNSGLEVQVKESG